MKLKDLFHIHRFNTPIISQYWSFNTRRMIYQCRCGCKTIKMVDRPFGIPFPIPTTNFLSNEEFEKILYNPEKLNPTE